ncbi:MAG: hypothetical protein WCK76_11570 [Elusimicrobiota bacterium]
MLGKIFFSFAVLALFPLHALSQEGPKKILLITQSRTDDLFSFGMALWRGMELQRAGMDVHVVFQGEAVAYFLGKDAFREYMKSSRTMEILVSSTAADAAVVISTECASGPVDGQICVKTPGGGAAMVPNPTKQFEKPHVYSIPAGKGGKPGKFSASRGGATWKLLDDFIAAKVPYTLCSLSAVQLGIYDKLKAAGQPLSEDMYSPVDISSFVTGKYQIIQN